jgi:hypothetical protein
MSGEMRRQSLLASMKSNPRRCSLQSADRRQALARASEVSCQRIPAMHVRSTGRSRSARNARTRCVLIVRGNGRSIQMNSNPPSSRSRGVRSKGARPCCDWIEVILREPTVTHHFMPVWYASINPLGIFHPQVPRSQVPIRGLLLPRLGIETKIRKEASRVTT